MKTKDELLTQSIHALREYARVIEMPDRYLYKHWQGAYSGNKKVVWAEAIWDWQKKLRKSHPECQSV